MKQRVLVPLLLVLTILTAPCAWAGHKGGGGGSPRATPVHHHTVIGEVSATSITVNGADGSQTYKIVSTTEITLRGETVTADKLETGMRVSVTPDGVDATVAGTITANDPPVDPTPKPKK